MHDCQQPCRSGGLVHEWSVACGVRHDQKLQHTAETLTWMDSEVVLIGFSVEIHDDVHISRASTRDRYTSMIY